ncbi:MAG: 16S rRNA (cytosine(967)-C(5))-methyltransferase RsmB [Gammaproteobacteria bacterium]|nr:16S rRNA (cytosine(967)-C(5))-methyltransferase RsmB [Gammaproteobacteria bacterium]
MQNSSAKVRAVAAEIVDAVVSGGQSLDTAIARHEPQVAGDDRALLRMLCFGTLRHHWQLQAWIDELISKPLRKRDRVVNALLAVGLYQLTEMRIPDHAVVSETVEATRALRRPKLAGLLNGCLRRFMREQMQEKAPQAEVARWNHPHWFIDALQCDWPDDWQSILTANNERAPMWLRVNSARQSSREYQQLLQNSATDFVLHDALPDAVCLAEPQSVETLPGFSEGRVSVQDGAAQIAARWLLQEPAARVLDACAAPGGKSGHLLELGGEGLSLVSVDSDSSRAESIRENLDRIGRTATIITADASNPEEWWDGAQFDAILLDAPCSASGVIRRHPDIKILRRKSDVRSLQTLQGGILRALWPLLAPGGRLLYATCSVLAAENDEVTGQFLRDHGDALENDVLPNNNIRDLMRRKACGYQILPGTAGLDGFYYAALEKQKVS